MQDIKITILQTTLEWEDVDKNLSSFDNLFSQIDDKPDLIVLPEEFNTAFSVKPERFYEKLDGKTMIWMAKNASLMNCVITGSLIIKENNEYFNTLIWMRPDGSYESYHKRHLFRMGKEHLKFSEGRSRLIVELKDWKICPLICYDLRFPVWAKNTFKNEKYEYDVLIYIANWPEIRSHSWKTLLLARAIENQAFVVGVNRIGEDGNNISYSGDSAVINPKGEIISNIQPNREAFETINLSYSILTSIRSKFNAGFDWDNFKISTKI
ncbi:MAG: amidohydrolase [Bacteroidales bacterium]|nr:amidohydrolase [Bacteroidales bacterium]